MAATNEAAATTASWTDKFRDLIPGLPSTVCRRRFYDVAAAAQDLLDSKSVIASRLEAAEAAAVVQERKGLLLRCLMDHTGEAERVVKNPYLYETKQEAAARKQVDAQLEKRIKSHPTYVEAVASGDVQQQRKTFRDLRTIAWAEIRG